MFYYTIFFITFIINIIPHARRCKRVPSLYFISSVKTSANRCIYVALVTHLRGKDCRPFNSDMKVLPRGDENPSYYPDVTVTCNPEDYKHDSTAIRSPRLVIEVLSRSTAYRDRSEKLRAYQACPSVDEYVMVSSHHQELEVYHRESTDKWTFIRYTVQQNVTLASVGLTILVSEIYAGTNVPPIASVSSTD
ncbi:MAG TPA: Uma2 family endonuclease [Ktedonobacteraceae bacterium]|nr:Uma2 family endonuclease [Ktedonobacteraceae bacterium]